MTTTEERVLKQTTREVYVKINILDSNDDFISEITGTCVGGSYNIDASSSIRRTVGLDFSLQTGYVPNSDSPFWINKRFQLFIGLRDFQSTDEENSIVWFNKGIYAIQDPNIDIQIASSKISISGVDKMALQDGTISGQLFESYCIKVIDKNGNANEIKVSDAIKEVIQTQVYKESVEKKIIIEEAGKTDFDENGNEVFIPYYVPHNIEKNIGDTKWGLISELTDLYYNYQSYYDINGYFRFEEKPVYDVEEYPIMWYFVDNILTISMKRTVNYNNIKNVVRVYGGIVNNYQPNYTIEVRGCDDDGRPYNTVQHLSHIENGQPVIDGIYGSPEYINCKYSIDKLNEGFTRDLVVVDDTYKEQEQCKKRAESEVWLHQNTNDQLSINCIPIYSLDANDVIYVEYNDINGSDNVIVGRYVIDSISCGLGYSDTMTINAHRLDDTKRDNVE